MCLLTLCDLISNPEMQTVLLSCGKGLGFIQDLSSCDATRASVKQDMSCGFFVLKVSFHLTKNATLFCTLIGESIL